MNKTFNVRAIVGVISLVASLLAVNFVALPASAAVPAVTSTSTSLVPPSATTALAGVSVSGYTTETLLVNLSTTIGQLSLTTTTGLTLSYGYAGYTGASLSFTGTQTNVNNALATLKYVGSSSTGVANVSINTTVNQNGISYFPDTGHFYQYVPTAGLNWTVARSQAQARTFNGQAGYLASIPTAAVNSFVGSKINGAQNVWAGGKSINSSSASTKRDWQWQSGPIDGQSFTKCSNLTGGCTHSGDGSSYYNWNSGEPNNANSTELYLEINYQGNGKWNDLANDNGETSGYVVEYGDAAIGGNFTGVYSASSNVTVASAPAVPTAVSAVRGDGQATVTWTAPTQTNGSAITGYTVTPYVGATAGTPQVFNTNATTQTLTGLTNGTAYTFKVKATNLAGSSADSTASSAVTPAGVPSAPTGVTATATNGQVTVAWTAPSTNGSAITGYIVTPYLGTTPQAPRSFGTALSQNITGLANGNNYSFGVQAVNAVGTGAMSVLTSSATPSTVPDWVNYEAGPATGTVPYSYTFKATGVPAPTYSVGTGALPAGLTLNSTTGVLSGTPTAGGTFTLVASTPTYNRTSPSITIPFSAPAAPAFIAANPPSAVTGRAYTYTFKATGAPALTFTSTGTLPTGLTLNATTGVLSGTPTASGTFTVTATNAIGAVTTSSITIVASPPAAPTLQLAEMPLAVTGVPFKYVATSAGNPAPTYSVVGTLPGGLTLDAATGVISGTPTGTSGTFSIVATNDQGTSTSQPFNVDPTAPASVSLMNQSPGDAANGVAYSYMFTAQGNPLPTFSVASGTLPTGLVLDPNSGELSGVPAANGDYTFTIEADNGLTSDVSGSITIKVRNPVAPTVVQANPPTAITSQPYSYSFSVAGNPASTYSYTGTLPSGLTLDPDTGVLSGVPNGSGTFTVTANNGAGSVTTGSITITSVPAVTPTFTNTAPPTGAVNGVAYSYTFNATGTPAPTFAVASGTLPTGITLNPTTGVLSGTPSAVGNFTFTISSTNNQGTTTSPSITMNVTAAVAPSFVTTVVPVATNTLPYSYTLGMTANPAPTFAIASGSLPAGLTLNTATGVISGIATGQGDSTFTVSATNPLGTVTSSPITITAQALATPVFTAATPPATAVTTLPYNYTFTATGTPAPTFSVDTGALPTGLTLNSTTGVLSGTPTATGPFTFKIKATNASGDVSTANVTITVAAPNAPTFSGTQTPSTAATQTIPYSYTFTSTGSPAPTFSLASGTLPPGVTIDANTGVLSGTPTTPGSYTFAIASTNVLGSVTSSPFTVTVSAPSQPVLTPGSTPPNAISGTPYSYTIPASASPAPTFAVASGTLPAGLTLDPNTGVISGTPTGSGTFTISITNSLGTTTTPPITIGTATAAAPVFTEATPTPAYVSYAYNYSFVATGYPAATYAVTSGSLPAGLTLDSTTGVLSGTPTTAGTSSFVVTASNNSGSVSTASVSLVTSVATTPTFGALPAIPAATVESPFTYTFPSAGNPTGTFAVASGSLPAGLTLDTTTGVLSGTPTAAGSSTFTISMTNIAGTVTSAPITIATAPKPVSPTGGAAAATPTGDGYWSLAPNGTLSNFGAAPDLGSMNDKPLNAPVVAIDATVNGDGYWEAAADGGVFNFGTAGFYGSMGGQPLNKPVVGFESTVDSKGYWMVASDGGVFAFGNAGFHGSMGGQPLNQRVVSMAVTPSGLGYWLVAEDGGVFAFGDAGFHGSLGAINLNKKIVGIAATPSGQGYWLVAADGGVFAFGDAPFYGSLGGDGKIVITAIIASGTKGYRLIGTDGKAYAFGI